jgi:hypothetical protein
LLVVLAKFILLVEELLVVEEFTMLDLTDTL